MNRGNRSHSGDKWRRRRSLLLLSSWEATRSCFVIVLLAAGLCLLCQHTVGSSSSATAQPTESYNNINSNSNNEEVAELRNTVASEASSDGAQLPVPSHVFPAEDDIHRDDGDDDDGEVFPHLPHDIVFVNISDEKGRPTYQRWEGQQKEYRNHPKLSLMEGSKWAKKLINPMSITTFMQECWDWYPCLIERNQTTFHANFSLVHVELLQHLDMKSDLDNTYPEVTAVRMTNGEHELVQPFRSPGARDGPSEWDMLALQYVHRQGYTLQQQHMERFGPASRQLAKEVSWALGFYTRLNIYYTPAGAQGFGPHYDADDVFVFQVAGLKHWLVYQPTPAWPVRESHDASALIEGLAPIINITLVPGDTLYIPRGCVHVADTLSFNESSIHVTGGVMTLTWADLVYELFEALLVFAHRDNVLHLPLHLYLEPLAYYLQMEIVYPQHASPPILLGFRASLPPRFAFIKPSTWIKKTPLKKLVTYVLENAPWDVILGRDGDVLYGLETYVLTPQNIDAVMQHRKQMAKDTWEKPRHILHDYRPMSFRRSNLHWHNDNPSQTQQQSRQWTAPADHNTASRDPVLPNDQAPPTKDEL